MTLRPRTLAFLVAAAGLAALFGWGVAGLHSFGSYPGPYGIVLNGVTGTERHVTNVVSAVTFDYRGIDTMGEEFILFAAVMGVALPAARGARRGARPRDRLRSDAGAARRPRAGRRRRWSLGLYVVAHGYITPGGGFQGGVVLAAGAVLVYLAGEYRAFRRVDPRAVDRPRRGRGRGHVRAGRPRRRCCSATALPDQLPAARHDRRRSPRAARSRSLNAAVGARGLCGRSSCSSRSSSRSSSTPSRRAAGADAAVSHLPYAIAIWIFLVGLYGDRHQPEPRAPGRLPPGRRSPRPTSCCSRSGTARRRPRRSSPTSRSAKAVDPVVQALTLTDVVVGVTVAALLLALAVQAQQATRGRSTPTSCRSSRADGASPRFRSRFRCSARPRSEPLSTCSRGGSRTWSRRRSRPPRPCSASC